MAHDRDLFWTFAEPEHLRARGFCRRLAGNREDGDDLYQDALVKAITRFTDLRNRDAFRPWLYRIILNGYKDRVRRPWWKRAIPMTDEIEQSSPGSDPTGQLDARRTLATAFRALTAMDRALVTMFELDGWNMAELAPLFGKTEGSLRVRLTRARRKMRAELIRPRPRKRKKPEPESKKDLLCVATRQDTD